MILTSTGKIVNPFSLLTEDICVQDIAYSLAGQRRFSGHAYGDYSVAEHSVLVMLLVLEEVSTKGKFSPAEISQACLDALFHDATEAYISDIPGPIKKNLSCAEELELLEDKVWKTIATKYKLSSSLSDIVKAADEACLINEMSCLFTEGNTGVDTLFGTDAFREDPHAILRRIINQIDLPLASIYKGEIATEIDSTYPEVKNLTSTSSLESLNREEAERLFISMTSILLGMRHEFIV